MLLDIPKTKLKALANFSISLAKILIASAVVGFFIPEFPGQVNLESFIFGSIFAAMFLAIGVKLMPDKL